MVQTISLTPSDQCDCVGSNINLVDEDGWSPLMYATYGGRQSVVGILLAAGIDRLLLSSST